MIAKQSSTWTRCDKCFATKAGAPRRFRFVNGLGLIQQRHRCPSH